MIEFLTHLFSFVCGQTAEHTWAPGGLLLPVCQRCTGLYAGALVAGVSHLALRPVPTRRWLWLHGAFLLLMVPFGFHMLPQGPLLRSTAGVLFGFGLVAFFWLMFPSLQRKEAQTGYGAIVLIAVVAVPSFGAFGDAMAAMVLSALVAGGALVLGALVLANVFLAAAGSVRLAAAHDAVE